MNGLIALLLAFAALGAADKLLGGRLGVAEEFDRGLAAMGGLCCSMSGIYCAAVTVLPGMAQALGALGLPFDPSLPAGMLLAVDMGGWAAADALAAGPALAVYSGLLVASTLGCLVSFSLPVALGSLPGREVPGYMQGVLWGVISLPAGLAAGGLAAGLSPGALAANLWPVAALCAVLAACLRLCPRVCVGALHVLGEAVRWLGILLFCAMVLGVFWPGAAFVPPEVVSEALVIVLRITAVVCGSQVAGRIAMARGGRWIAAAARRLGTNEYGVLGLMVSAVSSVSMLPLYGRMDVRGKVLNAAFTVAGSFVLGGQLAFVTSVAGGRAVAAYFVCKLLAGALAAALAVKFTSNNPRPAPGVRETGGKTT